MEEAEILRYDGANRRVVGRASLEEVQRKAQISGKHREVLTYISGLNQLDRENWVQDHLRRGGYKYAAAHYECAAQIFTETLLAFPNEAQSFSGECIDAKTTDVARPRQKLNSPCSIKAFKHDHPSQEVSHIQEQDPRGDGGLTPPQQADQGSLSALRSSSREDLSHASTDAEGKCVKKKGVATSSVEEGLEEATSSPLLFGKEDRLQGSKQNSSSDVKSIPSSTSNSTRQEVLLAIAACLARLEQWHGVIRILQAGGELDAGGTCQTTETPNVVHDNAVHLVNAKNSFDRTEYCVLFLHAASAYQLGRHSQSLSLFRKIQAKKNAFGENGRRSSKEALKQNWERNDEGQTSAITPTAQRETHGERGSDNVSQAAEGNENNSKNELIYEEKHSRAPDEHFCLNLILNIIVTIACHPAESDFAKFLELAHNLRSCYQKNISREKLKYRQLCTKMFKKTDSKNINQKYLQESNTPTLNEYKSLAEKQHSFNHHFHLVKICLSSVSAFYSTLKIFFFSLGKTAMAKVVH